MKRERQLRPIFTRRALLLGAAELGVFGLLGLRLYRMQVLEHGRYATLAKHNSINERLVAPLRGLITDRYGTVLAGTARHMLPTAAIVVVMVLLALPGLLPAQAELRAGFVMSSVFFWTLYRPGALPAPVVALIGVLLGLLGNVPLGVWSVLLLLEQAAVGMSRRLLLRQGFMLVWLAFAGCVAIVVALEWVIRATLDLTLLPIAPALMEAGISILFYPLVAVPLSRAHAGPAAPEQA